MPQLAQISTIDDTGGKTGHKAHSIFVTIKLCTHQHFIFCQLNVVVGIFVEYSAAYSFKVELL